MVCCLLTTLINPRNPDLEYKIKELNTQVASLEAALHTYVVYHYLLSKINAKNGVKSCQEIVRTRETEIQQNVRDVVRLDTELWVIWNSTIIYLSSSVW